MLIKNNKNKIKNKNLISKKIDISNFKLYGFEEGWAIIKDLRKNNKYGWISEGYTGVINPIFDSCYNFKEEFAIFKKDGKEGWINTSGKILSEGFDDCHYFKEGFAKFKKDGKWGWIDTFGNILKEGFDLCFDFKKGFALFKKDGKWGWIDKNGKIYTEKPY